MADVVERAPDGRRARWTEHRAERRADFVAAGAAAVDRFGPEVSAEQIAEVAEISRTVLYRYFRDREDLRQAVGEQIVDQVIETVGAHLEVQPDTTPQAIIETTVAAIIDWFDAHPNRYYFVRSLQNGSLERAESSLADRIGVLLKLFMMLFGVDADSAEPGAYGIVGLVESTAAWWLTRRTMARDRLIELLSRAIWAIIESTARDLGIEVGYTDTLPVEGLLGSTD